MIVDALGNPLALSLTGGNAHDITQAEPLASQVEPKALLADKGYDADSFITSLEVRAIKAVIPPKSTRKVKRACTLRRAQSRRAILQYHQALSRYRDTLRKNRAQLPCWTTSGLRTRLAQMTTGPRTTTLPAAAKD